MILGREGGRGEEERGVEGLGNVHLTWSVHEVDRKTLHPYTDCTSCSVEGVIIFLECNRWETESGG